MGIKYPVSILLTLLCLLLLCACYNSPINTNYIDPYIGFQLPDTAIIKQIEEVRYPLKTYCMFEYAQDEITEEDIIYNISFLELGDEYQYSELYAAWPRDITQSLNEMDVNWVFIYMILDEKALEDIKTSIEDIYGIVDISGEDIRETIVDVENNLWPFFPRQTRIDYALVWATGLETQIYSEETRNTYQVRVSRENCLVITKSRFGKRQVYLQTQYTDWEAEQNSH